MKRRGSSPGRPRSLALRDTDPSWKSASPSPASEVDQQQFSDDLEKFNEISEYVKEVDEILDNIKPFPRGSTVDISQPRPRLDHLENLIKLVEQLKDLKEKTSMGQQQSQLMKDFAREGRRKPKFNEPDIPPPPPDPPKKNRPTLPFRKSNRSKSLSTHEYFTPDRFESQRKSITQGKGKVSKWTKVKEAFRWEKTSNLENRLRHIKEEVYAPCENKSEDITESHPMMHLTLPGNRLQVPDKPADTPSPADSVLSGQISSCSSLGAASSSCLLASSGYSGEHSHSHSSVHMLDLHSSSHPDYLGQSLPELSSSSDDEKNDDSSFSPYGPEDSCKSRSIYEEVETRRSKSLDGENILVQNQHLLHFSKESLHEDAKTHKQHKTPWGKVIDIIQTRKDSLKKRPKKDLRIEPAETSALATWTSDFQYSDDVSSPEDPPKDLRPVIEITYEKNPQHSSQLALFEGLHMRPLTPVLTLTRPSTEELQNIQASETDEGQASNMSVSNPDDQFKASEHSDEKAEPATDTREIEEKELLESIQINMESADDGTRRCGQEKKMVVLPAQGRGSRWGRVKKAFLTSAVQDELAAGPASAPSSPSYLGSFFSDNESDELSSGEWVEDKHEKQSDTLSSPTLTTTFLEAEVKRNLCELEKTVSREIDVNAKACELVKTFTEKSDSDEIPRRTRESLSIPLPTLDDLSPEFKKKLDEWKKIKKTPATPTSAKEEPQGHFISKIGEWPKWRPGSSHQKTDFKQEHHLQEEFYKKLEEWQMLKSGKRSRSHSDRGKDDRDHQTPSPGLSRKNSKGASKKITSGKSSGTESLSGSLKEKEGRAGRKSHKEKDIQWLEKELHKIEREKMRLEREREKYLEREARLEQMKRTMGTATPSQEVLIQTATGFFRFQGISQKFTKKLYEWEKARGIAPEASTFALLERASVPGKNKEERPGLQRSKSVGSAIDSSSAAALSTAHHPSSLSLNDVDDLEAIDQANLLDLECEVKDEDEPEALIVDVEDVVEETAAMMDDEPYVQGQVPVYSYAPEEITRLIDSSSSDGEPEVRVLESDQMKYSDEAVSLIQENMNLLEILEKKEVICREIESNLEGIEEKIEEQDDASTPPEEILILEGENLKHSFLEHSEQQQELAHDLVDNFRLLQAANANETSVPYNVSQALDLSSQLLSLAQKLENTLTERNDDVKNLRKKIFRRRARGKVNRLGNAKVWYSTDEDQTPPDQSLKELETESLFDNIDVVDLPTLITKKVLELKLGLSRLKQSTEEGPQLSPEEDKEDDYSASFTVQVPRAGTRGSVTLDSTIPDEEIKPIDDLSPVSVTISPPQWPRRVSEVETSLAKSKVQNIRSDDAEDIFDQNLTIEVYKKEQKSPEVLKKKIKDKILEMQRLSSGTRPRASIISDKADESPKSDDDEDIDDSKVVIVKKNGRGARTKKAVKARRVTDTTIAYKTLDSEESLKKGFSELLCSEEVDTNAETPMFVFVPTTRKIISPVETDTSSSVISYYIDDIEPKIVHTSQKESFDDCESTDSVKVAESAKSADIGMPPLPPSPSLAKKIFHKETAPSIRMMIAKYNQKLTEQDATETTSGTSSPVVWRSPVLDRRIREQLDRFQKDNTDPLKFGGKFNREVHKSSSAGFIKTDLSSTRATDKPTESNLKGILKSSSTGTVTPPDGRETPKEIKPTVRGGPLALRALRIQQAKADFLAKGPGGQSWSSELSTPTSLSSMFSWKVLPDKQDSASEEMKNRNRMSHASVGSESSYDEISYGDELPNLIKSASAGMINLSASRRSSDEVEQPCIQKSVTAHVLPVDASMKKSARFGISVIKSRFRKVKMRKAKEKESAVSTLCRQSLLLDVSRTEAQPSCSKSCPSSPVLVRSVDKADDGKRWVPRYFKYKETKRPSSGSDASGNV